jgi:hypothetical protein
MLHAMLSSSAAIQEDAASISRSVSLRLARGIVTLAAALFAGTYLVCAALRWAFPWDIEWMEGGMITHAARVLRGLPIYAKPSIDFVAYFYTPLYAYVLAGLSYLTGGLSFGLARGVSIAASLATMGMLFYTARREQGSGLAGVLAVGLFAAMFRVAGAFYDLARVDSLSLALLMAAGVTVRYARTLPAIAFAALLTVLAFFAKQTSGIVGAFVALPLLVRNWRHGLTYVAVGGVLGVLGLYWLEWSSDGWFSYYIWRGHQGHGFSWFGLVRGFWGDLLCLCPFTLLVPTLGGSYRRYARWVMLAALLVWLMAFVDLARSIDQRVNEHYNALWYVNPHGRLLVPGLCLFLLLGAARWLSRRQSVRGADSYFLWLWLGSAVASALNYSTQWSFSNCFTPIAAFASLISGISLADLLEPRVAQSRTGMLAAVLTACAVLIQFGALVYDPRAQVPSAADRRALKDMLTKLERFPGPIFMPAHPLYSYLRDGTLHAHAMGYKDVAGAGGVAESEKRLKLGGFPTVVMDEKGKRTHALKRYYREVGRFNFEGTALKALTGSWVRPEAVLVHRNVLRSGNVPEL